MDPYQNLVDLLPHLNLDLAKIRKNVDTSSSNTLLKLMHGQCSDAEVVDWIVFGLDITKGSPEQRMAIMQALALARVSGSYTDLKNLKRLMNKEDREQYRLFKAQYKDLRKNINL